MPGEDQERFEDYLELERFISELQAGHVAHPPQELTPARARIYRMATLFHAATPGASEPHPDFAAQLQMDLENELQTQQDTQVLPLVSTRSSFSRVPPKQRISRRRLLTGGAAAAAASVAVGAGIDHMAEKVMSDNSEAGPVTHWFPVATLSELGNSAIKFRKADLIGYIVRYEGTDEDDVAERGKVIAMSAACTHKGCIVQWSGTDRTFQCPCHGGVFAEDGGTDTGSSSLYLQALPRLEVQIRGEQIYVRMPAGV
ncbi:MAG TPA: Rieske (2Fe-2S) protein [Ktedonobacteraceae bacterium]|nr:Rieske (2Fe-2S) protein [Ktedonobacteraceae bacterium]